MRLLLFLLLALSFNLKAAMVRTEAKARAEVMDSLALMERQVVTEFVFLGQMGPMVVLVILVTLVATVGTGEVEVMDRTEALSCFGLATPLVAAARILKNLR